MTGEGEEVTNPFFGDLPSPGFTDSEEENHHAQDDFELQEGVFHELRDDFRGFEREVFLDWHDCHVCVCHGVDLEPREQNDHGWLVAEQHREQHELGRVVTEQRREQHELGRVVAEQHREQHELGRVVTEQHREQHELGRFACMLGTDPPQEVVQLSSSYGCRQSRGESTVDPSLWDHLWLADSGASIHLIAESLLSSGHADLVREDHHEVRCTLASGEFLSLTRRVTVRARFLTASDSLVCCELTGMLVDNVHSLLSLGSLAAKGWTVTLSKQGFCVRRRQLKLFSYWGSHTNVGWLVSRSLKLGPDFHAGGAFELGLRCGGAAEGASAAREGEQDAEDHGKEPSRGASAASGGGRAEDHRGGTRGGEAQAISEAGGCRDADSGVGSRGEVPEPSMGEASEPMETWSVVTEEPRPAPVDDDQSEEDAEELRALRRLRESVKKCVEGMHSHIAKEIKEAAVKAMPRKAEEEMPRKAVASKAMPKTGKKRGSAAADKEPGCADKKPKDMRKPAEPEDPPSSSSKVSLVPRDQRVYRFPPPPRVPSIPKPPAVPKAAWPKGLPKPPPAPDAWV